VKPKNFVGRRERRRARATARTAGLPMPDSHDPAYVLDIKIRVGAKNRDAQGVPR
jgi:hypothetical protein